VKKVVEKIGFRRCLGEVPIRSDEFEIRPTQNLLAIITMIIIMITITCNNRK